MLDSDKFVVVWYRYSAWSTILNSSLVCGLPDLFNDQNLLKKMNPNPDSNPPTIP